MAYVLGAKSRANLAGVHPALVRVVKRAIGISEQDFTVQEGLRSIEAQREYLKRGVTKTLKSMHLKQADGFGHAVDLVPWIGGMPRWEWPAIYPIAAAMRAAAEIEEVRLRWGGSWDCVLADLGGGPASMKKAVNDYCARHPGPDFIDGPHYELTK